MNALWTVTAKEMTDLFRDRRTVMVAFLMGPLLMPFLVLGISKLAMNRVTSQLEKPLEVPVVGAQNAPNLIAWLEGQNIVVMPPPADPDAAIRDQSQDLILSIEKDYGEHWRGSQTATVQIIHDSSRDDARIPVQRLQNLLDNYSQTVGSLRLVARGVSPGVMQAVRVGHRDLATPQSRIGQILAFLPYMLILTGFLGGMAVVVDVTAGERERQSLEPLLATPASRGAIVSGKMTAAALLSLVVLVLTLLALKLGAQFAPGIGRMMDIGFMAIAKMMLILVPIVFIGTSLLTFISAGAKSVKEAQGYMSLLMMLPILPTIVLLVSPVKNQLWMFAVPFLAQNQMLLKVIRGELIAANEWLVYFAAGLGIVVVTWLASIVRYNKERLAVST